MEQVTDYLPSSKQLDQASNLCGNTEFQKSRTIEDLESIETHVKAGVARLWKIFSKTMGSTFIKQYGEIGGESYVEWCKVLSDLTLMEMRQGVQSFYYSDDDYINAKRFRRLCKNGSQRPQANWQAYLPYKPKGLDDKSKDERNQRAYKVNMDLMKDVLK